MSDLTERGLGLVLDSVIEASATRDNIDPGPRWREGEPLRLLLVGYNGVRNTGSDVRVIEMVRQLRHVLGDEQVHVSVTAIDPKLTAGYFPAARALRMPVVYPPFLFEQTRSHHGVVACEGSMFKSQFSNALTLLMAGALGLANAQDKLAVGYGGEAGKMEPALEARVRRYCRDTLVLCRNEASCRVVEALGMRAELGSDTAWTFSPSRPERVATLLRRAGVGEDERLLVVCPVNPFMWPVRPDLPRALLHAALGVFHEDHYESLFFHERSRGSAKRYDAYLEGLASAVAAFAREEGLRVVLVGMERLDRRACDDLAARLWPRPPVFGSADVDAFDLVGVLHRAELVATSRYHAVVLSMIGGVPSVGVSIDERIPRLMEERGHPQLCVDARGDGLSDELLAALRWAQTERARVQADIRRAVVAQLKRMASMGQRFGEEVVRRHPGFPFDPSPRSWERYLPPLPPSIEAVCA